MNLWDSILLKVLIQVNSKRLSNRKLTFLTNRMIQVYVLKYKLVKLFCNILMNRDSPKLSLQTVLKVSANFKNLLYINTFMYFSTCTLLMSIIDQFLVSGSNGTTLNRTLVSPSVFAPGYSCLSLDVAKFHLHPYSASFLNVSAYQPYNRYSLVVNDFGLLNSSWKNYEFTVQMYYGYNLSLQISATTFQAYIAVDNVKNVPGYCQSGRDNILREFC